jgi:hypothetical protein
LHADFGGDAETAVFLTVMPDGYEEQTRYATGSGKLRGNPALRVAAHPLKSPW